MFKYGIILGICECISLCCSSFLNIITRKTSSKENDGKALTDVTCPEVINMIRNMGDRDVDVSIKIVDKPSSFHIHNGRKTIGLQKTLMEKKDILYAVGCHEMGHVLQYVEGVRWKRNRIISHIGFVCILVGVLILFVSNNIFSSLIPFCVYIIANHMATLYIEYDASYRAKRYLRKHDHLSSKANSLLNYAFGTYLVIPLFEIPILLSLCFGLEASNLLILICICLSCIIGQVSEHKISKEFK